MYFNNSGSEKAKSPVLTAKDEIDLLNQQIIDYEGKKRQMETLLGELRTTAISLDDESRNLGELMKQLEVLKVTISKGEALGKEVQSLELKHSAEDNLRKKLEEADVRVDDRLVRIDELERQNDQKKLAVIDQEKVAIQHQARADILKDDVDEIRRKQANFDSALAILRPLKAYREAEHKLAKLRADKDAMILLEADIGEKEAALLATNAPGRKEVEEVKSKQTELRILQARIQAQSVLVKFMLRDVEVRPEPNAARSEGGEYVVSQPTTFTLGDVGTVSVKGHEVLDDELQDIASLEQFVVDALARYHVSDINQLNDLAEARAEKESVIANKRSMLSCSPKIDQGELDSYVGYLEQLRGELISNPDVESLTDNELEGRIKLAESERVRLEVDLKEKVSKMDDGRQKYTQALESKNKISSDISDLDGRMITLRDENRNDLRDFSGIRDELKQALTMKTQLVRRLFDELEALRKKYKDQFDGPKSEMSLLETEISQVRGDVTRLGEEKAGIGGQIKRLADEDVLDKLNSLEERRDELMHRMLKEKKHSEALKLLNDLVTEIDGVQSAALSGPIKSLVDRWLAALTSGEHTEVHIDEGLYPIKIDSGQAELELERLSRGTKDQIDVLTRLAVGVLSAQNDRNLVVIDDRLVNSDPTRIKIMCQILDEVCSKCQIIMTTCDATRFGAIPNSNLLILP